MNDTKLNYENWCSLKRMLRHGDVPKIAKAKGVSKATVYRCLDGGTDVHGILEYTYKLFLERDRLEENLLNLVKRKKRQ